MKTKQCFFGSAVNITIVMIALLSGQSSVADSVVDDRSLGEKCWHGTYSCKSDQETITLKTMFVSDINIAKIYGYERNSIGTLVLKRYGEHPQYSVYFRGTRNREDNFACATGQLRFNDKDYLCE